MLSLLLLALAPVFTGAAKTIRPVTGHDQSDWKKTSPHYKGNKLEAGQVLNMGDFILSNSCEFMFIFQKDSNAVVYRNVNGRAVPVWSTFTCFRCNQDISFEERSLVYQRDNNMVMYRGRDARYRHGSDVRWHSDTHQNRYGYQSPDRVEMKDNGDLVMYLSTGRNVWSTGRWRDGNEEIRACFACDRVKMVDLETFGATRVQTKRFRHTINVFNCGRSEERSVKRVLGRSITEDTTQTMTLTRTLSQTFNTQVTASVEVTSSAGIELAGIASAGSSITAGVSATAGWVRNNVDTKTNTITTRTVSTNKDTQPVEAIASPNTQVTWFFLETYGVGTVQWRATGICFAQDGNELMRRPMSGEYSDVRFYDYQEDCPKCSFGSDVTCPHGLIRFGRRLAEDDATAVVPVSPQRPATENMVVLPDEIEDVEDLSFSFAPQEGEDATKDFKPTNPNGVWYVPGEDGQTVMVYEKPDFMKETGDTGSRSVVPGTMTTWLGVTLGAMGLAVVGASVAVCKRKETETYEPLMA